MTQSDQLQRLEDRLYRIESIDAIKTLKSRYFMACDTKNPELMRQCFVDGEVHIDYGPVGQFKHRDELVKLFTEMACHKHMLEMHHGHNPVIELSDSTHAQASHAKATWELCYQLINTKAKTLTQLALIYHDEYVKTGEQWLMQKTATQAVSTLIIDISGDVPRTLHAG